MHFSVAAVAVTWRHKSRHLPSLLLAIADKTLVVQFTVKHEQKIDCGSGYVKVRRERGRRRRGEYMYTRKREGVGGSWRVRVLVVRGVCTCVKFLS